MNILIIEDEQPAFKRLSKLVLEVIPSAKVIGHIDSIQGAIEWFAANDCPEIVFLDIHLADGSAFDLVKKVKIVCPIIFTTAYDQYAVDAFKTSSIDYLLKPVKKDQLEAALQKLRNFKQLFATPGADGSRREKMEYKKRFVVRFGEHIKTLPVTDIAYFYSENKVTIAKMADNRNYPMDHNLDNLESMLDPQDFFRINRQYLISLKAIEEMKTYSKARVIVKLTPPAKEVPVVSSERAADFKDWLAGEYRDT